MLSCTPINFIKGDDMNALSKALEDVRKHYKIDKTGHTTVDYGQTTTLRFKSEKRQFIVVVYEIEE